MLEPSQTKLLFDRTTPTTPESAAVFAGRHLHLTTQRDAHLAAGATLGAAAGAGVGLYAVAGGLKTIANHGPLSIEAHADALQVLADKSVTVASAGGQIKVLAKEAVVLKAGQCTVSLEGGGVTLSCPGSFTVKSASHAFMGPVSKPAALEALPSGRMGEIQGHTEIIAKYDGT